MDKRHVSLVKFLYKFYILISTKWDNFIEDMFGMGSGEEKK